MYARPHSANGLLALIFAATVGLLLALVPALPAWAEEAQPQSESSAPVTVGQGKTAAVSVQEVDGIDGTYVSGTLTYQVGEKTTDVALTPDGKGALCGSVAIAVDAACTDWKPVALLVTTKEATKPSVVTPKDSTFVSSVDARRVTGDLGMFAFKVVPTFAVTFEDGQGNVIGDVQRLRAGEAATAPAAPTRAHYTFAGWDKEFTNVTADTTVNAKWTPIEFTVTFADGQGGVLKTQKVLEGSGATAPADPTRVGYTFNGWDKAFANVTADITVNATWKAIEFTVTFTDGLGGVLKTQTVLEGSAATAPAAPTRAHYTFNGWDKAFSNVTANITVSATWKPVNFTVTFADGMGNVLKTQTVLEGSGATAPTAPTRAHYTFSGWDKAFANVTANTTVNATWKAIEFTVTFVDGLGGVLKTQKVLEGSAATAPASPARAHYTFNGWDKAFSNVTANITVSATWKPINFTVTFTDGQGGALGSQTVLEGSAATAPADPTREGYTFAGWDAGFSSVTANLTVNAKWIAATPDTYTVTFTDGQGRTLKAQTVEKGGSATAPANPTRAHYTFAGWDKAFSNVTADLTVTAIWTPINFTVTFADGQGKTLKTQTVLEGSAATAPASPTRAHYTFAGWDKAFASITADLTVTAIWTPINFTITFTDGVGGVLGSQVVLEGSAAAAPANPTRGGFTFAGWDADFSNVTADLTVNATWTAIPSGPFTDTPAGSWYVRDGYLDYVVANGLMTGTRNPDGKPSGLFLPNDPITRAQVAVIIYRYCNPESDATSNSANYGTVSSFADVPIRSYCTAAIQWCYQMGIITGYKDGATQQPTGYFGPNDQVTREQLAVMVCRLAKVCGASTAVTNRAPFEAMPDHANVHNYAAESMAWCAQQGIITGDLDASTGVRYLNSSGPATRAQMSKIITVTIRDVLRGAPPVGPLSLDEDVPAVAAEEAVEAQAEVKPAVWAELLADGSLVFSQDQKPTDEEALACWDIDEAAAYTSADEVPWAEQAANVLAVRFKGHVAPVSCAWWFAGMANLESVDFGTVNEGLDLVGCTSTAHMFDGCANLAALDTTALDTSAVTESEGMFNGCAALTVENVTLGQKFTLAGLLPTAVQEPAEPVEPEAPADPEAPVEPEAPETPEIPAEPEPAWAALMPEGLLTFGRDEIPTEALESWAIDEAAPAIARAEDVPWAARAAEVKHVVFTNELGPLSCAYWFYGMAELESVDFGGITPESKGLELGKCTTTSHMFEGCAKLVQLDTTRLDTAKVTDATGMFDGCAALAGSLENGRFIVGPLFTLAWTVPAATPVAEPETPVQPPASEPAEEPVEEPALETHPVEQPPAEEPTAGDPAPVQEAPIETPAETLEPEVPVEETVPADEPAAPPEEPAALIDGSVEETSSVEEAA